MNLRIPPSTRLVMQDLIAEPRTEPQDFAAKLRGAAKLCRATSQEWLKLGHTNRHAAWLDAAIEYETAAMAVDMLLDNITTEESIELAAHALADEHNDPGSAWFLRGVSEAMEGVKPDDFERDPEYGHEHYTGYYSYYYL